MIHGGGDRGKLGGDGILHHAVLVVHDGDHLQGGHLVDMQGVLIAPLGLERAEIGAEGGMIVVHRCSFLR